MENVEKFIPKKVQEKAPEKAPEKDLLESEEKLPPNVKIVETEKAKFRIAYGRHDVERKPEELGKANAWLIETGNIVDYTAPKELVEEKFNKIFKKDEMFFTEHSKILEEAERKKTPIFLGDITEAKLVAPVQALLRGVEPIVGLALLASLGWDSVIENKKLTRREFLKRTLAGIYFLSEAPGVITANLLNADGVPDEKSARRTVDRFLNDLNEGVHPEMNIILVTLRNSLFAQKMKTIAEKLSPEIKDRKPEVAITVGARHHEIEKALANKDEERVRLIDKLLSIPGLEKTREKIATIARFDFNKEEDKWELTD